MLDLKTVLECGCKDCNQYFSYTSGRIRTLPDGKWRWVTFTEFCENGEVIQAHIMNEEGKMENLTLDPKKIETEFFVPEPGVYNYKGTVMVVSRKFHRQWKKGLSKDIVFIDDLISGLRLFKIPVGVQRAMMSFGWRPKDFELLFEGMKDIPFEKCMETIINEQAFARAIDNRVSISQGIFSKLPTVWFRGIPVAEVDLDKMHAPMLLPYFRQEIELSLGKHGFSVKG